jgi:hypothetical protein
VTPGKYCRRLGDWLMRFAMRITPPDQRDWARAMQSEMNHVEGDWAALRWAIGGASVLARRAVVQAILPGSTELGEIAGKDLIAKEGSLMRKTTLAAAGACVVASLLFFVAPAFRQAFQVSLTQWHDIIHTAYTQGQPAPEALVRRAEEQHDAEGIAFAAIRDDDETESARLAEEAVHLDPNLTWIYATVAVRHPMLPDVDGWVAQLERWDSQNALPYLITAERIDIDQVEHEKIPHSVDEQSPAWKNALAAASASHKLDPYLDRLTALDRSVLLRYSVDDPYQSLNTNNVYVWSGLPSYSLWDCSRYVESLLRSGDALEARGDRKGAPENYLTAARFGNLIGPSRALTLNDPLQDAYNRLAVLSQQDGKKEQASLYVALAGSAARDRLEERASFRQKWTGGTVTRWDASVVKASGLLMLFFALFALICIVTLVAKSRSLRLASLRASRAASAFLIGSVAGMLLSSAMLYVSYRPYAEMFRSYVRYGDESRMQDLTEFLSYTQMPLGVKDFNQLRNFELYFWCCFFAICLIALVFMVLRQFKNRPRIIPTT